MSTRRIVEVFTHRSEDGTADWMMKGNLKLNKFPEYVQIDDIDSCEGWIFPWSSIECIKVSIDRRTQADIDEANDRNPE